MDKQRRPDELAAWRSQSATLRAKFGIPRDAKPWTSRRGVALRGVSKCERALDVIDTVYAVHRNRNPKVPVNALIRDLFCDWSQMVGRVPGSVGTRTATTNTSLYSYHKDCCLTGLSNLKLLGWSTDHIGASEFSSNELKKLAGESYSLPLCTLIVGILHLNPYGSWH